MTDFQKIQLAMGAVKDIDIDPETGRKVFQSNKSLLEKSGAKLDKDQLEKIKEIAKADVETKQDINDYVKSYQKMAGIPETAENPQPTKVIAENAEVKVQKLPHENEYMANLVKQINRRK